MISYFLRCLTFVKGCTCPCTTVWPLKFASYGPFFINSFCQNLALGLVCVLIDMQNYRENVVTYLELSVKFTFVFQKIEKWGYFSKYKKVVWKKFSNAIFILCANNKGDFYFLLVFILRLQKKINFLILIMLHSSHIFYQVVSYWLCGFEQNPKRVIQILSDVM